MWPCFSRQICLHRQAGSYFFQLREEGTKALLTNKSLKRLYNY